MTLWNIHANRQKWMLYCFFHIIISYDHQIKSESIVLWKAQFIYNLNIIWAYVNYIAFGKPNFWILGVCIGNCKNNYYLYHNFIILLLKWITWTVTHYSKLSFSRTNQLIGYHIITTLFIFNDCLLFHRYYYYTYYVFVFSF